MSILRLIPKDDSTWIVNNPFLKLVNENSFWYSRYLSRILEKILNFEQPIKSTYTTK